MQRLEIWLSPPDRTALGALAIACGLTQSALARMVLKSALAHPDQLLPGIARPSDAAALAHGGEAYAND